MSSITSVNYRKNGPDGAAFDLSTKSSRWVVPVQGTLFRVQVNHTGSWTSAVITMYESADGVGQNDVFGFTITSPGATTYSGTTSEQACRTGGYLIFRPTTTEASASCDITVSFRDDPGI